MTGRGEDVTRTAAADRLITAALDAVSAADGDGFAALLTDGVVIETDRRTHVGVEAARAWAARRYDHLDRRYRIIKLDHREHASVVDAFVEYLWRGEQEVADSSSVRFHFELSGDRIARIELRD